MMGRLIQTPSPPPTILQLDDLTKKASIRAGRSGTKQEAAAPAIHVHLNSALTSQSSQRLS
jgi:hypothetical protein